MNKVLLPRFSDPRALARELLNRNWLTSYQVNQLLQGSVKELVLGPYNILQRLDDSYLGQVYKARHQHLLRLASLTIVRENLLAKPGAVERFYQEIQAASRLTHAHILCALDAGPIGRTHFLAIEYVEGIDLEKWVQQSGPLPAGLAASFMRQTALGLQHAHERRLLHHDLKPANLLVSGVVSGESSKETTKPLPHTTHHVVKICNLGLTLLRPRAKGDGDTLDYLAPEQTAGAPPTDVRSSLYSLGCVFYYLLTGRPPFPNGDSAIKRQQHQKAEPEPVEAFRKDVPGIALDVLQRLLAKRPEDRYATPAEAAKALAAVPGATQSLGESGITTLPGFNDKTQAGAIQARIRDLRIARRKWLPWAAGSAVLLVATVFAGVWFSRATPPPASSPATEATAAPVHEYKKGPTRHATILATLKVSGFPNLEGKWYYIGPFDNSNGKGFDAVYPPEKEIDLTRAYPGKDGAMICWQEWKDFRLGQVVDLRRFPNNDNVAVYLYHEMHSSWAEPLPISFGSDDTLTVWGNGHKLVAQNAARGCEPDQALVDFPLRRGKNELLIKVCNRDGGYAVYVDPRWPANLEAAFGKSLYRDFPPKK